MPKGNTYSGYHTRRKDAWIRIEGIPWVDGTAYPIGKHNFAFQAINYHGFVLSIKETKLCIHLGHSDQL